MEREPVSRAGQAQRRDDTARAVPDGGADAPQSERRLLIVEAEAGRADVCESLVEIRRGVNGPVCERRQAALPDNACDYVRLAPGKQDLAERGAVAVGPLADLHGHLHRVGARHDVDMNDVGVGEHPKIDGLVEFVPQRDHLRMGDLRQAHVIPGCDAEINKTRAENVLFRPLSSFHVSQRLEGFEVPEHACPRRFQRP